jgi:hypothetical protein
VAILPSEIMPALQGVFPATLVTCSAAGVPNATSLSQVHYVDAEHVALSFQFFNKTIRNVRENPRATIEVMAIDFTTWNLELRFDRSETEGPIFDQMDMQLEAIASMYGMSGVFKLKGADIYFVEAVRRVEGMFK